ncbi:class I adenylate-forming enzyme family protein [Spongiactinospora sp. TRM90649]|uniref:class I adenylate-forming enzyme family protein n=1 Tax=Spongiactinospora sp. TRM90649 TaxID=3031114 RepID=UPI0023F942E1|nr:class I adenylate-forming enzyme family protein [Spongiactinospora sp. TRM90649]MDF5753979.1 class I adenylate-forming enzyme family protein [Spongiactinospora sp. TRM90649]
MLCMLAGEAARRFGGRAAFDTGGCTLSFAELDRLSDGVAAGMAHRGVRIGDLVALVLPDGIEYPICFVAAAKLGAVAAGVPPGRPGVLHGLAPTLVVTERGLLPPLPGQDVVTLPGGGYDGRARGPYDPGRLRGLLRAESPPPPLPPDPRRPVAVVFTRGRRGPPRGAVFADAQLEAIRAHGAGSRWGTGDARLVNRPLTQVGFTTRIPVFLQTGRTVHVLPRWEPEAALRVMVDHGLGVLQGTPDQLAAVLAVDGTPPPVRLVLSSGGPARPELVRELRERFGAPVCNRYMCTEAGLGLGTRPEDPPEDAEHSVGRPRSGVALSVRDPAGRPVPEGGVGEVLLRSNAVMAGYRGDPVASSRVIARDGYVRTGDMGFIDQGGRLRLVATGDLDAESRT